MSLQQLTDTQEFSFSLDGLNCAGCIGRAEKALQSVQGVQQADVNLATARAHVRADASTSLDQMNIALRKAGYPMRRDIVDLELHNLSCASCVGRAEAALRSLPGVVRASVNLASSRAQVEVVSGAHDVADLCATLTRAGYPAHPLGDQPQGADGAGRQYREQNATARAAIVAAVLTVPVFVLEMGGHMIPAFHHWLHHTFGMQTIWMIQFLFTTVVLAGPGRVSMCAVCLH